MVRPLSLYLLIQVIVTAFHLANFLIGQVDGPEDIRLTGLRAAARGDCDSWHLLTTFSLNGLAGSPPNITHVLLLGNVRHRLRGVVRNLLRLLIVVVIDVLFD